MLKSLSHLKIVIAMVTVTYGSWQCQNNTTTNPVTTNASTQPKPVSTNTKKLIRNSLFNDYYKKSLKDVASFAGGGFKLKVDSSEGFINIYYVDEKNEGPWGPDYQIHSIDDFIEGDINNDGYNDLIVCIPWHIGSRPKLDIHCYITTNKQLKFFKMYTANDLGICNNNKTDTSGKFFPSKIENGYLLGQTDCFQSGDPGCCPSLEMISYFKFENGLQFAKQERKKR